MPSEPTDESPFDVSATAPGFGGEEPSGGWTPPVEDPLFGPLPTYSTGAYPLLGHHQGGYPVGGHQPGAEPSGGELPGAVRSGGHQPDGTWADPGPHAEDVLTGGLPLGPTTGQQAIPGRGDADRAAGYTFHLRAATSPLPTLAERPDTTGGHPVGHPTAPAADRTGPHPTGPHPTGPHPTGVVADDPAVTGPISRVASTTAHATSAGRPGTTDHADGTDGTDGTPYPEDAARSQRPPSRRSTTGNTGALERPVRSRVALSRQQAGERPALQDEWAVDEHAGAGRPPHPNLPSTDGARGEQPGGRFRLPVEEEPRSRRRPRGVLAVLAGIVLVAVAAAAVLVAARSSDQADGPALPPPPSINPEVINSAETDREPVGANEFFPDPEVTVQGRRYTRIASDLASGCPGLSGQLATTLKEGVCTQLVRALYLSTPTDGAPQVLAGMSVFVVDTQTTAQAAAKVAGDGAGGVAALPIPQDAIKDPRILTPAGDNSWRAAVARGHYVILTQLAYVDGSQGAGEDAALRNTITDLGLIAAEPIEQRMIVDGTPTTGAADSSGN